MQNPVAYKAVLVGVMHKYFCMDWETVNCANNRSVPQSTVDCNPGGRSGLTLGQLPKCRNQLPNQVRDVELVNLCMGLVHTWRCVPPMQQFTIEHELTKEKVRTLIHH
jgi:hypothetical protein